MTLTEWLENSFVKNRSAVAVRMKNHSLTYAEIDQASRAIAHKMRKLGVRSGSRVALHLDKTPQTVAAIIAALRLGAAYIPLDLQNPPERKRKLLEKIRPTLVLQEPRFVESLGAWPCLSLTEEAIKTPPEGPLRDWEIDAAAPAYILFTSGSTGEPRAVEISQSAALAFTRWAAETFSLQPGDSLAACSGFHFDLSTFDLFSGIGSGATVVLVPGGFTGFPAEMLRLLEQEKVSVLYAVPSTLSLLAEFGGMEKSNLAKLRLVLSAGDVFPCGTAKKLQSISGARVFNLYGPTETNVCTYWEYDGRDSAAPIGLPIAVAECFIVNDDSSLSAPKEVGELIVNSATLMTGYCGDSEGTERSMLRLPNGKIGYRTGDLAYRDESGVIYFCGRKDAQLKYCGYRVHPIEIESVLRGIPGVTEAAVIGLPDPRTGNRLLAFLESRNKISEEAIKEILKRELPAYMIPEEVFVCEILPRNTNGKVNRKQLAMENG